MTPSEHLEQLHEQINKAILAIKKRIEMLDYESPIDIDRHDDDVAHQKKCLNYLKETRDKLEDLL